jgi:hypothetical protein
MRKASRAWAASIPFGILVSLVVLINIPILNRHIWFEHDSNYFFQASFGFYNHFFYHGDLPRWFPYSAWGIPAYWQHVVNLSPFTQLTGFVSGFARFRDVQWMLKFSMLLEHITYLLGTYLYTHRIFKHKWSAIFATLGMVTSSVWIFQIYWDFRVYYLLPLIFYCINRFWEDQRPHWFWLSGAVTVHAMIGNIPYFAPLYALILLLYTAFHVRKIRLSLFLERSLENVLTLAFFAISAAAYLYFVTHMFEGMLITTMGRDPDTGLISLSTFLTFGINLDWGKYLGLYLPRAGQINGHIYIGILALVFLLYGLVRPVRTRTFWALFTLSIFFVLFPMGKHTPVATLVYHIFPPIRVTRYIGDTFVLLRPLLLLVAGFGLDRFLDDVAQYRDKKARLVPQWVLVGCAVTVFGLGLLLITFNADEQLHFNRWPEFLYFGLIWGFLGAYLVARVATRPKWIGLIAALFLGVDLLICQYLFINWWPNKLPWTTKEMVEVHEYNYLPQRTRHPDLNPRMKAAARLAHARPNNIERNHYLLHDPCVPYRHYGYWAKGVFEYIQADHIIGNLKKPRSLLQRHLSIIFPIVGCGTPKLRLISFNASVPNMEIAKRLVFQDQTMFKRVVFHEPLKSERVGSSDVLPSDTLGNIDVKSFTFHELIVDVRVDDPRGAWLFYPDAYHPEWKAYVDGERAPIEVANLGFKAVALKPGSHNVRLIFDYRTMTVLGHVITFSSFLFVGCILLFVVGTLFPRNPFTASIARKFGGD